MEKSGSLKTFLGTALLFTIIVSAFLLFERLTRLLIPEYNFNQAVQLFLGENLPWIITAIVIIVILSIYTKMSNQKFSDILHNRIVCLKTSILIISEGIINLVVVLPGYIYYFSISSKLRNISVPYGENANHTVTNAIYADVISIVIILCQIVLAVYFLKRSKKANSL